MSRRKSEGEAKATAAGMCDKDEEESGGGGAFTAAATATCSIVNGEKAWLPDGCSQIFRLLGFGPSHLKDFGSATLHCKI